MLTLDRSWSVKNAPKLFSKYFIYRICKTKQCLNYVNWWYKSNYSEDILKSTKKIYEKLYTNETTVKAATSEFLSKIPNWKKISNETSLDEIIKSVNSQTKLQVMMASKQVIYKHFSNELGPVLLDVYDSWESLAP